MPWVESLDWSVLNSLRRYPIREGASVQSTDGYFSIPDALIVDFSLSASNDVTKRFYVSSIYSKLSSLTVQISDFSGVVVGSFDITTNTHELNKDYYLNATDDYVGAAGRLTIGDLSALSSQPAGLFNFLSSATELEPRTITPGLQGVSRIKFIDAAEGQHSLSGDVTLISRKNLKFSYVDDIVLLDVGDGLGLNAVCETTPCVKTLNGVSPDPTTGNISLLGLNCLSIVNSAQYTLSMEDTCCTPCAGCTDLEELTTRLTSLENRFLDLKNTYNAVNSHLNSYLSTVNASCACP